MLGASNQSASSQLRLLAWKTKKFEWSVIAPSCKAPSPQARTLQDSGNAASSNPPATHHCMTESCKSMLLPAFHVVLKDCELRKIC